MLIHEDSLHPQPKPQAINFQLERQSQKIKADAMVLVARSFLTSPNPASLRFAPHNEPTATASTVLIPLQRRPAYSGRSDADEGILSPRLTDATPILHTPYLMLMTAFAHVCAKFHAMF